MRKHRHPWVRRLVGLGLLAGVAYAVWRATENPPEPFPDGDAPNRDVDVESTATTVQEMAPVEATTDAWVEVEDGVCPVSHPVKGKLKSGIYHLPGGASYDRTTP